MTDEIRTVLQNGITCAGHGSIRNCKEAVTPFPYGGIDNLSKIGVKTKRLATKSYPLYRINRD